MLARSGTDIIHHRADVVGALFQCRHFQGPIGKAGAAFVETNQSTKFTEPFKEQRAPEFPNRDPNATSSPAPRPHRPERLR